MRSIFSIHSRLWLPYAFEESKVEYLSIRNYWSEFDYLNSRVLAGSNLESRFITNLGLLSSIKGSSSFGWPAVESFIPGSVHQPAARDCEWDRAKVQ